MISIFMTKIFFPLDRFKAYSFDYLHFVENSTLKFENLHAEYACQKCACG